jgi:hypothetical protein
MWAVPEQPVNSSAAVTAIAETQLINLSGIFSVFNCLCNTLLTQKLCLS